MSPLTPGFEVVDGPRSVKWRRCAICGCWVARPRGDSWVHQDGKVHADTPVRHAATPGVR